MKLGRERERDAADSRHDRMLVCGYFHFNTCQKTVKFTVQILNVGEGVHIFLI